MSSYGLFLCARVPGVSLSKSPSLRTEENSHWIRAIMASLQSPLKVLIVKKKSYIESGGGVGSEGKGLQHMNLGGGGTIQPITVRTFLAQFLYFLKIA